MFRLVFGANNVQVDSPAWLSGNFTISTSSWLQPPLRHRLCHPHRLRHLAAAYQDAARPLIRAVMQNRNMAACMGVRTERVNMLTFAFGSGLAGLAGAFLSQIGNVGPNLGQNYIVDAS